MDRALIYGLRLGALLVLLVVTLVITTTIIPAMDKQHPPNAGFQLRQAVTLTRLHGTIEVEKIKAETVKHERDTEQRERYEARQEQAALTINAAQTPQVPAATEVRQQIAEATRPGVTVTLPPIPVPSDAETEAAVRQAARRAHAEVNAQTHWYERYVE